MNDIETKKELSLTTSFNELEEKILKEENLDELKNIINIFNLNIQKQEVLRNKTLLNLEDSALNEIKARLDNRSAEFSNEDLLKYYKIIRETISKSPISLDNIPTIQINQNNLNVNIDDESKLSKESRDRITEVVRNILNKQENTDIIDAIIDIKKENDENGQI